MASRMQWIAVMVAALLAASAWAGPPAGSDRLAGIVEQQRALQQDLESIERLTARQRNVIRKMQGQVFALTDGKARIDDLTIDEKVALENALERINAELVNTTGARNAQETCWRERATGSKLEVTRCGTARERDEAREGARAWMEKPKVCVPPGCGS